MTPRALRYPSTRRAARGVCHPPWAALWPWSHPAPRWTWWPAGMPMCAGLAPCTCSFCTRSPSGGYIAVSNLSAGWLTSSTLLVSYGRFPPQHDFGSIWNVKRCCCSPSLKLSCHSRLSAAASASTFVCVEGEVVTFRRVCTIRIMSTESGHDLGPPPSKAGPCLAKTPGWR